MKKSDRRKKNRQGKKKNHPSRRRKRSLVSRLFYTGVLISLWAILLAGCYIAYVFMTMPQLSTWQIPDHEPTIRIVDRHGSLVMLRGRGEGDSSLAKISPQLVQAVIAIEDQRFYQHYGFDPIGIARALWTNVRHKRGHGGSTITQQLAKNLFLSSQRSIDRKVRELLLALWLEQRLSKDEILALYLNRVYFGAGAYGVEAAAQRYFNKSAFDVNLFEAALLAGLLKAPSKLSPAHNPKAAHDRALLVLASMHEQNMIDTAHYQKVRAMPMPKLNIQRLNSQHYVADYVLDQLPFLIGEIEQDIIVETSLDGAMQQAAEMSITREITRYGKAHRVSQGALVSLDRHGGIVALVGGVDYATSPFNRAVDAKRQPGSIFKPFVYLAALEQGKTPQTKRKDAPVKIGNWTPRNANNRYLGEVTLTTALAHSLNSVAAQLLMEVGADAVIEVAHRLGIHSGLDANATLALGTSEVSLLEMTGAFVPFANGGIKPQTHLIRRILNKQGKVLYDRGTVPASVVIAPHHVRMMHGMLRQSVLVGTAKGAALDDRPVAGKTGTSQQMRDAWFIGYSGHFVTGVWFGNDDGTPMKEVSGGSLPVSTWKHYMQQINKF